MATEDLCWLPATELAAAIRRKCLSPVEVLRASARFEQMYPWAAKKPPES